MKRSELRKRENLLDAGDEVSVSVGLTIQVGERDFIKADVAAKSKVRKGETGDQALDRIAEFAEARLSEKIAEYQSEWKQ
jgi:hypothetical protein